MLCPVAEPVLGSPGMAWNTFTICNESGSKAVCGICWPAAYTVPVSGLRTGATRMPLSSLVVGTVSTNSGLVVERKPS